MRPGSMHSPFPALSLQYLALLHHRTLQLHLEDAARNHQQGEHSLKFVLVHSRLNSLPCLLQISEVFSTVKQAVYNLSRATR